MVIYISMIIFIVIFGYINYINFAHLDYFMTSDLVNEIQYIKFIVESGQWIPENFIPSFELFTNRPAYISAIIYLFVNDIVFSYQITFFIMQIIFAIALYILLKSINIKLVYIFLYMSLFWSFGNYGFLGAMLVGLNVYLLTYISMIIIIYFIITDKIQDNKLYTWCICIICAYLSCSGPKLMAFIIIPVVIFEIIEYIIKTKENNKIKLVFKVFLSSLVGIIINKVILSKWINLYSFPIEYNGLENGLILFIKNIETLLSLFISLDEQCNVLGIIHLFLFIGWLISIAKYNKIFKDKQKDVYNILGLSTFTIIMGNIVMGSTGEGNERYYISFLLWIILGNIIVFQNYVDKIRNDYNLGILVLMIFSLAQIYQNFSFEYTELNNISETNSIEFMRNKEKIAEYILNNKYERVYGAYWNTDILLYNSNFNYFKVGHWGPEKDFDLNPYYWLVDKRIFEEYNGKIALLLTDDELYNLSKLGKYRIKDAIFKIKIGNINIYECTYNPIKPLINLPKKTGEIELIKINNPQMSVVGKMDNENLFIDNTQEGYVVFGPYIDNISLKYGEYILEDDIYDIKLEYKFLNDTNDKVYFDVAFNGGTIIKRQALDKNNEKCILKNVDLSNKKNIEFRVFKEKNVSIEISNIQIIKN